MYNNYHHHVSILFYSLFTYLYICITREYLEHLEAIGRYITSINKVDEFKDKISESRKRPNSYFGYAVSIPLDVDPSTADAFFKDLPYE